jgi:hypothetical protein
MASKPAPDSCPSQSSRVSESIHEGADRIVALIKTEKEKQALFHEAQLKDLESRHNQLKNNTALIYASASLRILRLEAELEDVKKEQLKAITEARAATERVKTELTEANSWLDRLNASLKENGMTYLDGAITFDDETVRRVDELLSEARNSGDVGLGKDAFDADTAQAPSLLIVSGIAQYLKLHKRAILEREDMYRTLKRDGDLGKRRTDEAMDTTADPLDAESIASKPEYSSSTGALKCSDSGSVTLQGLCKIDHILPQGYPTILLKRERRS